MDKRLQVGILTFNNALNYGAVLQAYALKYACEELGYETHVINYAKNHIKRNSLLNEAKVEPNKIKAIIKLCRDLLSYKSDQKRTKEFEKFRKDYLSESKICVTKEEIELLGYDIYIAGSDQIWNYNITGGKFDSIYFGEIGEGIKCIIYAASSHDTPFPLDKELEFKEILNKTTANITIREQKLADYVGKITGKTYPVVLDPVLLVGRKGFISFEISNNKKEEYILIYQIDSNPYTDVSVKKLENYFGCKAYTMTVPRLGSIHGRLGTSGPVEFINLLKNAKFLVTNSFHGIAFSLIYEKEFFVYDNGGVMSRIDNLLTMFELHDRKIKLVSDINIEKKINYTNVRKRLTALQKESLAQLKRALSEEDNSSVVGKQIFSIKNIANRNKNDCSGCSACIYVCPSNAISMEKDEEGFLYPFIQSEKCVQCGKCDEFCSFKPVIEKDALPNAYGLKHKDESIRVTSRSGAAFVAFSDIILDRGGSVYGAVMQDDFTVCHMRAETKEQRNLMKTAKYVQSDMKKIYKEVLNDLKKGKEVLFSGTPCQIAGLLELINEKNICRDNLICCDLVCHGVPSPDIWEKYVEYIEYKYNNRIVKANFRDKQFGWDSHCESFVLNNGKKIVSRDYTDLFYEHLILRPACHNCYFANINRVGDLTLADFWGIEKNDISFNDNKGVSLVLINSDRGEKILEEAKNQFEWIKCDVKNCIQPTLVKPSAVSPRREDFWEEYKKEKFSDLITKYTTPVKMLAKYKRRIKQVLYYIGIRKHP